MCHLHPQTATFQQRLGACLQLPSFSWSCPRDFPTRGTGPIFVGSCRQSPLNLFCSPVSHSVTEMSQALCLNGGGCLPQSILWWASPCFTNPLSSPQTVNDSELSFCTLIQNYNNIPQFENSFKTFSFGNPAASPSLDRSEPHKRKIPP